MRYKLTDADRAKRPRCEKIKRNGQRCGSAAVSGQRVCRHHGGVTPHSLFLLEQRRMFMRELWPQLTGEERGDAMLHRLPWAGKVPLALAMISARVTGDPVILLSERERLERKHVGRLTATGWFQLTGRQGPVDGDNLTTGR